MRQGLLDLVAYINLRIPTAGLDLIEVGSYKGDSARIFASAFRSVTCVDAWDQTTFNVPGVLATDAEAEFDRVTAVLANVRKIKGPSLEIAKRPDLFCDVLYIDAGHDYDSVSEDLDAWEGRARLFVCGHDYWPSRFPGVVRAVNERFGKPDAVFCDSSFVVAVK
jgi:hypothetical protein